MKAKFGAIVVDGRGKVGGHVFSKNRGGAYMRTKVTPSNPQTSAQSEARALLSSLSQSWSGLSKYERLAWINAVTDYSTTDIFGDIKSPSGLNLYVKMNANRSNIGLPPISAPLPKVEVPSTQITNAILHSATGILDLSFSDGNANGTQVLIRATPPLSAGVSFVKSQFRVIGHDVITGGSLSLPDSYVPKFGSISNGSNVHVSIQLVMSNGQKSTTQQLQVKVMT